MKITRSQLKQIIKEEISKVLTEQEAPRVSLEEYERVKEEYNLQNVDVEIGADSLDDGPVYFQASIWFEFGDSNPREKGLEEARLEFPIRDILENNRIYPERLDIYGDDVSMVIGPSSAQHQGIEGFHDFMREMYEIDKIYDEVKRELTELLEREGVFQQEMELDVEEEPLRLSAPQPGSSERMRQGLRRQQRPRSPGDFRSTKDRWEV